MCIVSKLGVDCRAKVWQHLATGRNVCPDNESKQTMKNSTTTTTTTTTTHPSTEALRIVTREMCVKHCGVPVTRKMTGGAFARAVADVASCARCAEPDAKDAVRTAESSIWKAALEMHNAHGTRVQIGHKVRANGYHSIDDRVKDLTPDQSKALAAKRAMASAKAQASAKAKDEALANAIALARAQGLAEGMAKAKGKAKGKAKANARAEGYARAQAEQAAKAKFAVQKETLLKHLAEESTPALAKAKAKVKAKA